MPVDPGSPRIVFTVTRVSRPTTTACSWSSVGTKPWVRTVSAQAAIPKARQSASATFLALNAMWPP
jgi:hypothetical protein